MAPTRREGLRLRIPHAKKEKRKNDAERMRQYRQRIKEDPTRYQLQLAKDAERNKKNRERPKTDEEKARIREQARLRMQKTRERRKAEKAAEAYISQATEIPEKWKTRACIRNDAASVAAQRQKWAVQKRKEREKWSSQKWRRHREKSRQRYHLLKADRNPSVSTSTDPPTDAEDAPRTPSASPPRTPDSHQGLHIPAATSSSEATRKSRQCLRKTLLGLGKSSGLVDSFLGQKQRQAPETPESKRVKLSTLKKLQELSRKRDKKSMAARNLLLDIMGKRVEKRGSPYKRKKMHAGTEASLRFFEEIAVNLPGKRTVNKKTQKQRKVLPKRLCRLYREFKEKNPGVKTSLRSWYRILPSHIKTSRHQTYRTALCEVCVNIDLKLDVVNRHLNPVDGRDVLSEVSTCSPATLSCIERQCKECGTKLARQLLYERLTSTTSAPVTWSQWEMVKKEKGQRKEKVEHTGTVTELIESLLHDLAPFTKHVFVHRWQHMQFRTVVSKVTSQRIAVAVCDFAENHLCRWQDEVHSAHWGYSQVTVHPTVLYYACQNCNGLVTDYLVFLSDDLNHDAHMAHTIIMASREHVLVETGIEQVVVWSDGCAAQYKSKLPFFHCSNSSLERHYFGSRHGKSACDACGGVVKAIVDDDVRCTGAIIQNAQQMYDHLQSSYQMPEGNLEPGTCCHTKRSFRLVRTSDIDRSLPSSALSTVRGTRQLHSIRGLGENTLATRNLSCFCSFCLEGKGNECASADYVNGWETIKIAKTKSWQSPDSSPTSVPSPHSSQGDKEEHRDELFQRLSSQMAGTRTFAELLQVCKTANDSVAAHVMPHNIHYITSVCRAVVDAQARDLLPSDAPPNHLPLVTVGDGNCFLRALSTLCFGTEEHHLEMRVRLVVEMALKLHLYTDPGYIAKGTAENGDHLLGLLKKYAVSETYTASHDSMLALKNEIFVARKPGQDCSMWHVYGACNVVQAPLVSVYPDLGVDEMRQLCKRTILPSGQSQGPEKAIMWTASCPNQRPEYWAPHHFVPLLRIHPESVPTVVLEDAVSGSSILTCGWTGRSSFDPNLDESTQPSTAGEEEVSRGTNDGRVNVAEFYSVTWTDGKDYVCQVKQIDVKTDLVNVHFMVQVGRGNLYTWPTDTDESWEPLGLFKGPPFQMKLDEGKSTQRKQYFSIN
ncbi:hypothetical protein BaRGS_00024533, partial [Batillaria attramentaria]